MWVYIAAIVLSMLSAMVEYGFESPPVVVFVLSALAIIALADCIRRAADQIASLAGSAIGGLLAVTLGNTAELILALFVLGTGAHEIVKGQITGSVIANGLLAGGLAIVVGTWGGQRIKFHRARANLLPSLLILALIGLSVPGIFHYTESSSLAPQELAKLDEHLSLGVAGVLILVYVANLAYTLYTHYDVFAIERSEKHATWSWTRALTVLVVATAITAFESNLLSQSLAMTGTDLGLSSTFLGVVVLAIIGNAADYFTSLYFARAGRLAMALSLTTGSTIQVALLVAPLLVLISFAIGDPMNLVFVNPLELVALAAVAFAVNAVARSGEATWFVGVLLVSVYVILAMAFFFLKA